VTLLWTAGAVRGVWCRYGGDGRFVVELEREGDAVQIAARAVGVVALERRVVRGEQAFGHRQTGEAGAV
jgi:hypothetical protein